MIVAGVGTRAKATADEIVAAVRDACDRAGFDIDSVRLLAGLERPETGLAMRHAAVALNIRAALFAAPRLAEEGPRCVTHSERSMAAAGVPSVAEAAAMAAAGPDGMLFLPRIAFATVTVALAVGPERTEP